MRTNKKQTMAVAAAGTVLAILGGTGIAMAADNGSTGPSSPAPASTTLTPAAGTETGVEGTDDGADQGPDANPNEPGHQDANEADDATEGPENSADDAAESATEGADDGADQGPDANPNEPGHQDANEADDATEGPENSADDAAGSSASDLGQADGEQADD